MGYWIIEFVRVLFGYVFMMYLWPSVIFRKKLSGKSLTFQFAFCSTVSILLVNTAVLGLGLVHILKGWLIACIFYGIFIISVLKNKELRTSFFSLFRTLFAGTLGGKTLIFRLIYNIKECIIRTLRCLDKKTKGRKLEYSVLSVLIIFAVAYFSYGAFQCHSYGWGDMYVHHAWIYGLKEGKIFSEGVYPEAMHCFVYCMNVLFGIPVYSCLLFMGEIHVSALIVAVYCLFREVMKSKYTVYLILTAFLTVDVVCVDEIYGISRLQYTIPQEFGLYTQFLCALYLICFIRRNPKSDREKKKGIDKNLFLFTTSLAASIVIHFYVTIMAFFLCASFALLGITRIFRKENFRPLVVAVIAGGVISTTPMILAFATGTPLQGSLNWGMNIINGTDTKEGRTQVAQNISEENNEEENSIKKNTDIRSEIQENQTTISANKDMTQQIENNTAVQKHFSVKGMVQKIIDNIKLVYKYGYAQLYGEERAGWIIRFTLLSLALGVLNLIIYFIRLKKFPFEMYLGITFASVFFMILYAAPFLGLPEIIAGARLCLTEQILLFAMMAVPFDGLFFLFEKTKAARFSPFLSLLGVVSIYAGTHYFGIFHGYLYYELTRYNSVVEVTNSIIENCPKYQYTIISTTEELYQAIESGRHEEILDFYNRSKQEKYIIPTEYLFFYVEKKPIQYAQYHFFTGPRWLAQAKYTKFYKYSNAVLSEGDEIANSQISEFLLNDPITITGKASDAYSNIKNREILESEMYFWCQKFKMHFPNEIKVYYEDEDFICYVVKQNTDHLYDLSD